MHFYRLCVSERIQVIKMIQRAGLVVTETRLLPVLSKLLSSFIILNAGVLRSCFLCWVFCFYVKLGTKEKLPWREEESHEGVAQHHHRPFCHCHGRLAEGQAWVWTLVECLFTGIRKCKCKTEQKLGSQWEGRYFCVLCANLHKDT